MLKASEASFGSRRQQILAGHPEPLLRIVAEVAFQEGGRKEVEARRHGGVSGEEVPRPGYGQGNREGLPGLVHKARGALPCREGRVAFIEVTDFGRDAEGPQ
jgi:hypothetical protein